MRVGRQQKEKAVFLESRIPNFSVLGGFERGRVGVVVGLHDATAWLRGMCSSAAVPLPVRPTVSMFKRAAGHQGITTVGMWLQYEV